MWVRSRCIRFLASRIFRRGRSTPTPTLPEVGAGQQAAGGVEQAGPLDQSPEAEGEDEIKAQSKGENSRGTQR